MAHLTIAQMLIRKPASIVFNAFIDPAVTAHFWFTKSSGLLKEGKTVTWEWEMYNAKESITVFKLVPEQLITISWAGGKVDFIFRPVSAGTYVKVAYYDYPGNDDFIKSIVDNVGGDGLGRCQR